MPGEISRSYDGPGDEKPQVPAWALPSHSPRPWAVQDEREIIDANGVLIAEVLDTAEGLEGDDPTARANALLIVSAVNRFVD